MSKIIKILFLLILSGIFFYSCGTKVPTKTKVTKTENIVGEPKKVFLTEQSEKVEEKLFYKTISDNSKVISYEFKIYL